MQAKLSSPDEAARRRSLSKIIKIHKKAVRVRVVKPSHLAHPVSVAEVGADGSITSGPVPGETSTQPEPSFQSGEVEYVQADPEALEQEYDRGYADGYRAAEGRVRSECDQKLNEEKLRIGLLLANVQEQLDIFEKRAERTVIRLAVAVAEQIMKREIVVDKEAVLRQIREALRRVMGVGSVRLRVHPADEQMVREHRAEVMGSSDSVREIIIEADDQIPQGGCILESESGNVDARLSTQLKKIEAALNDVGEE
jgi:flagellar assembly protein FliH